MNPTRHRQGVMGIWHLAVYNNQFHYNLFTVRLCLVAVKRFPKNTYFPEMLISRKGKYFSVFGCISKNFPENIFWCLEKKKENTNPRKISSTIAISPARSREGEIAIDTSRDRAVDRDLGRRRDRAVDREIAIFAAIIGLEIGAAWSSDWRSASPRDRLTVRFLLRSTARALSLSLSLSLSLQKCFEVKMRGENHFRV